MVFQTMPTSPLTDTDYNIWLGNVSTGISKIADTNRFAHPNRSMNPVWSPMENGLHILD